MRGLKSLSLPIYADGYNADVSNCWDYSIAGAAGSFDRENYFYYCALYGLCMNYSVENFDQSRILEKLGLAIGHQPVRTKQQFIDTIREHIDRKEPILFPAYYNICQFFETYLEKEHGNFQHMLVIDGYCHEKEVLQLREYMTNVEVLANITKAHVFSKYWYSYDMMYSIYQKSRERDMKEHGIDSWEIHYLTSLEETSPFSYHTFTEMAFEQLKLQKNQLIERLLYLLQYPNSSPEVNIQMLRRSYYHSLTPLFDGLQKGLKEYLTDGALWTEFENLKDMQLKIRYIILSLCHKCQLHRQKLNEDRILQYIDELRNADRKVYAFLAKWKMADVPKDLVRIAVPFQLSVSSECATNPASHMKEEGNAYWESEMDGNVHWVEIEPMTEGQVSNLTIHHHPYLFRITKDFRIEGSNNRQSWSCLDHRIDNMDAVTVHPLSSNRYRYYRIYITKPGEIDYSARITRLELFQEKN